MTTPTLAIIRTESAELSRVQDNVARSLNPVLSAVAATPIMGAKSPAWILASLLNGFTAWGAPFASPSFHRDALGYVHVGGFARTAGGSGAQTIAFVLPVGYRPASQRIFATMGGADVFNELRVDPLGNVTVWLVVGAGLGVSFELSFLAEQ